MNKFLRTFWSWGTESAIRQELWDSYDHLKPGDEYARAQFESHRCWITIAFQIVESKGNVRRQGLGFWDWHEHQESIFDYLDLFSMHQRNGLFLLPSDNSIVNPPYSSWLQVPQRPPHLPRTRSPSASCSTENNTTIEHIYCSHWVASWKRNEKVPRDSKRYKEKKPSS